MKRKKKLIRVISLAAVLSAGLSFTSLAEEGWAEEEGGWAYYDGNGVRAASQLLEIDGDYYYFGEDGLMVSNQWVSIENFASGDYEPDKYWYYFQNNGKAYRCSDNTPSGVTRTKEIDGKKYAFDSEGRMLYGWVLDGERLTEDDAWMEGEYYFGDENDGSMKTGWQKLHIIADLNDEVMPNDGIWEDEEQDRWFYFSEKGKKFKGKEDRMAKLTIHGQKYGFDEYGRMISSWYADPTLITTDQYDKTASAEENLTQRQGGSEYTKEFMYFGSPESGAQYTKGWFSARPSRYLMESKHLEDSTYMYYADGEGHLYANEIRTIDGEKYAFDNYGRQIRGLVCLEMEEEDSSSRFLNVWYQDKKDREFSSIDEFNDLIAYERNNSKGSLVENYESDFDSRKRRFYYFGGKDGQMLTGTHEITLTSGEKVEFCFANSGRLKGSGLFGKKDDKLYKAGMLLKPAEGQKYAVVRVEDVTKTVADEERTFQTLNVMEVSDFIDEICNSGIYDEDRDERVWTVRGELPNVTYYLIGQNGKIVKNKKRATDGEGYQFCVKNGKIQTITVD